MKDDSGCGEVRRTTDGLECEECEDEIGGPGMKGSGAKEVQEILVKYVLETEGKPSEIISGGNTFS